MVSCDYIPAVLASDIKSRAMSLGFDAVGICDASPSRFREYLRGWLDDGRAGTMEYLHKRFDERTDVSTYFPGAKSVICVALNYHVPLEQVEKSDATTLGRVARYALGDDYHEHMKDRLRQLGDWIEQQYPDARTRSCVDTAPLMEKELSARAGVGWVGKNTCLINERIGSWVLLGEIVTTLELPADDAGIDRCGTCRRCLDACPTQAITAPYELDASRCISYLTIEHRADDIPADLRREMGDWMFGCDICQDVCPWNSKAASAIDPLLMPRFASGTLDASAVANWDVATYRNTLRHSAIKRTKLPILQRNARIVLENRREDV